MVELIILILIIYGLVRLIMWITPYIATGLLILIGGAGALGLLFGTFFGVKNYISSIIEKNNIRNTALKITMLVITSLFILTFISGAIYTGYRIVQGEWIADNTSAYEKVVVKHETFTNKIVNSDGLNVRARPSPDASILFVLYRNTVIQTYDNEKTGDWVKINYNGKEGYVNQTFLKEAK